VGERRGPGAGRAEPRAARRSTGSKSVGVCGCSRRRLRPTSAGKYLLAAALAPVTHIAPRAGGRAVSAHVGPRRARALSGTIGPAVAPVATWPNVAGVAQPRTASANFKRKRIEFAGCRRQPAAHPRGGMGGCARLKFNPKRERENASALALREVPRSRFALAVRLIWTPPPPAQPGARSPADHRDRAARHGALAPGAPLRRPAPRPDARTVRACLPPARAAR